MTDFGSRVMTSDAGARLLGATDRAIGLVDRTAGLRATCGRVDAQLAEARPRAPIAIAALATIPRRSPSVARTTALNPVLSHSGAQAPARLRASTLREPASGYPAAKRAYPSHIRPHTTEDELKSRTGDIVSFATHQA